MKYIQLSGSKSETNRLLILQKLFSNIEIKNISNAQDSQLLIKALNSCEETIDIHHAGTAMRFLTAFFAIQDGKTTILTGSKRMKQRPIAPLVDALKNLGAEIHYIEKEGHPPIKIYGKTTTLSRVKISANISSQFITALILIGGKLENGLQIELIGKITSRPYLEMSLEVLRIVAPHLKNKITFIDNIISIPNITELPHKDYTIESDWSSASYFYSYVAISHQSLELGNFKRVSLQGDASLVNIYEIFFGIKTQFDDIKQTISLTSTKNFVYPKLIKINMNDYPDIAQTLCVTATALKIHFEINGLSTLKVKETDRLVALQNELLKLGCHTEITNDSIKSTKFSEIRKNISIKTYDDHRMAMAFAPFRYIHPIHIENPEVVEKSYPNFWVDWDFITKKGM
jgi:3-phosphoshikimate 1-carboxyvinyltransferase